VGVFCFKEDCNGHVQVAVIGDFRITPEAIFFDTDLTNLKPLRRVRDEQC
jgi:hypothetical protein